MGRRFSSGWNGIVIFWELGLQICIACNAFSKYAWVKPLKDKAKLVPHGFLYVFFFFFFEIVKESKCQPNKLWFDEVR